MGSKLNPPPILDHYDDHGAAFLRELGSLPVPEFVKTAADMATAQKHEVDFALVADTANGRTFKFPVVDKGNTFLSAMYFQKTAHALPDDVRKKTAAALATALEDFGFTVPSYITDVLSTEKVASAPMLAIEIEYANKKNVNKAQELVDEFAQIHPMARPEAARMLKEAGVALPDAIACYARDEVGSDFEAAILARSRFMLPDAGEAIKDLVKVAHQVSVDELASELYEIDQEFGLTKYYDTKIADPYRSVLGTELRSTLEKVARATSITIDNIVFTEDAIRDRAAKHGDKIDDLFGDTVSTQLVVDPIQVLGSLPVPHQQALARILNDSATE